MGRRIFKLAMTLVLFGFCVCAIAGTGWTRNEEGVVYLLGDSLSDPGNLYDLTGSFPPRNLYPEGTFSNGPVWAEYFAEQLGVELEDLAYGGAFTGVIQLPKVDTVAGDEPVYAEYSNYDSYEYWQELPPDLPGVPDEVRELLHSHRRGLNPRALYFIWAGANDFFAATENPDLIDSIFAAAAKNIATTICTLSKAGARHFAVANLPDIGLTPSAEGNRELITYLSDQFNARLEDALDALPARCADTLVVLDVFQLLREVVRDPADYGLKNVTAPCMTAGTEADCSTYLFWDTVHPTTYGHALLADLFRAELCGTWSHRPEWCGPPHQRLPPIWRDGCHAHRNKRPYHKDG